MQRKILFINACVRENSRTEELAKHLLSKLDGEIKEVCLHRENIKPLTADYIRMREDATSKGDFSDASFTYAHDFAEADEIVIAAPYWDLSFPSALKVYIENICVIGLTFGYSEKGEPTGLCKASRLHYVTTAGAPGLPYDFGYGYVKAVCNMYFGIQDVVLHSAEGLDILGADVESIMRGAKTEIDKFFG